MSSVILNPSQATYVSYGAGNNNYNSNDWLRVGVQSTTATRYMTLIQFDLSGIPSHSIINSAILKLWSYSNECWQAETTQLAKRVTSPWTASSVTYNTRPTTIDTNQASMTNAGYDEWYEWNVKNIAQEWSNGTANYGFWLIQDGLTIEKGKCYKKSGTYTPQLVIDYTPVGMRAKVSGFWKNCLVRAKYSGAWKLCRTHAKVNGVWEKCK